MAQELRIRPARLADFDAVFPLFQALWPDDTLDEAAQQAVYNQMLAKPEGYRLLVAERGGALLGFGSVSFTLNAYYSGRLCYVMALVVSPGARGDGIGGQLLAALEQLAQETGCNAVELDSGLHRTAAHAFYEAKGYERQGYSFKKYL